MLQEFVQAVEETARSVVNEIHTAIPGRIVAFNAKTCTATIQPVGKFVCPNGRKLDYPKVTEVPFCFPFSESAGAGVVLPVKEGDSCLIVLSEIELDEWRNNAISDVEKSLKFDLTSAIAIPGLLKKAPDMIKKAIDNDAVIVSSGSTSLMVSKGTVTVEGNLKVTGSVYAGGDVTASGKSLVSHTHTAYADGGETTRPN